MKDIAEYGFLTVFAAICLAGIVYAARHIVVSIVKKLDGLWERREDRITQLEKKVDDINNGQRSALEKRLDASTDAEAKMAHALEAKNASESEMAAAIRALAAAVRRAPCGQYLEGPPPDDGGDNV